LGGEGSVAFFELRGGNDGASGRIGMVMKHSVYVVKQRIHGIEVARPLGHHHEIIDIDVCVG
jgi:hypothetical protein